MKKNNSKKILISIFIIIILLIIGVGGYSMSILNKVEKDNISKDEKDLGISKETQEKIDKIPESQKITNIALFGLDTPESQAEGGRSDSIMIVTIDQVHNKLKLTSIMRDSYVNIAGHGMDKINHAYAFGGPQLAINTLNSNFDLNISDYAMVNFSTLPQVVDALGGVEITIKDYEVAALNKVGIYSAGAQTLNGTQALAYCRIRYSGNGDYERTERHRTVLNALFAKLTQQSVSDYVSLTNTVLPLIKTSLSNSEIIKTGTSVLSSGITNLEQERFPLDEYSSGQMIDGIYYLTFDEEATKNQIHKYIFEDIKPE